MRQNIFLSSVFKQDMDYSIKAEFLFGFFYAVTNCIQFSPGNEDLFLGYFPTPIHAQNYLWYYRARSIILQ